ncbi:hypothetical protein H5410_025131 [Solanum commersonii]|uniref:Alcohol dehydrogenase-like N-terminal domain-containing protein n=1 Tax=Solanum commersonii TaxID=4109 RepID=A0A9J5YV32_SOLCO|nr:hypothetical protein H5410_025131 [Solanum commersonii]
MVLNSLGREANKTADKLACLSHGSNGIQIFNSFSDLPAVIKGLTNMDKWGFPSLRIKELSLSDLIVYKFLYRHDIVGEVTEVGSKVEKFKVGDKAGVGCLVESCQSCENCNKDIENYCSNHDGTPTYGGY